MPFERVCCYGTIEGKMVELFLLAIVIVLELCYIRVVIGEEDV